MRLPQLKPGNRATIDAIQEQGMLAKRLADLGFVRGAEVVMIKRGSPCIVNIQGRSVGLGAAGQRRIVVRPTAPDTLLQAG